MWTKPAALAVLAFGASLATTRGALAAIAASTALPAALRTIDPRTLSSGLYLSFASEGHFGGLVPSRSALAVAGGGNKGLPPQTLDARVGANVLLGDDSPALPPTQRSQAEPHLWRSAADPEFLVGTFQDGRFAAGGGAIDCGYALSHDGGLSWTRALIPNLTTAGGGAYVRATDPVAAVDLNGKVFLVTLAARLGSFADGGVVVASRSTDGGGTFGLPVVVATGSAAHSLDKEWLAVNDHAGTPHANRLVVTYTDIDSTGSYDLFASVSDDAGATWSAPGLIKPRDASIDQATQPFFLPDGSLLVPYITHYQTGSFRIECKRSIDGGTTFPSSSTVVVAAVSEWVDPALRNGSFLITAWVARETGAAFVTYVGLDGGGQPRVFVTKSTDNGATWSVPVAVSDNPAGVSVLNAAIAVSPDGQRVTVSYYDKRNAAGSADLVDLYATTSPDGGASWSPGLRLTEYTSDVSRAPLTSQGYMLGDYQGLVPPFASDQPAVALTVDTRNGDGDPCAIRYALDGQATFAAWRIAHFDRAALADPATSGPAAGSAADRPSNLLEYALATDSRPAPSGTVYTLAVHPATVEVYHPFRGHDVTLGWETSLDRIAWTPIAFFSRLEAMPALGDVPARLVGGTFQFATAEPRFLREVFTLGGTRLTGEVLPLHSDARLVNVSTRGQVKTGESQLIVGFVTAGGAKTILVRGVGPTLGPLGIANPLPNPQLDLQAGGAPAFAPVQNDDWSQGTATAALFSRLGAMALPANSLDAALVQTLAPRPYSAVLSDTSGRTGIALVEAYDADAAPGDPMGPHLINLSSRGEAGTGENVLIGGFVIVGAHPMRVLLRAVGPTLADQGVVAVLADPVLTLSRNIAGAGQPVASNDDWQISPSALAISNAAGAVGAFALRTGASRDAALLLTLEPGVYSAQVSGFGGTSGVALVEIYDAD